MGKLKEIRKWLIMLGVLIVGFVVYRYVYSTSTDQKSVDSVIKTIKKNNKILADQKDLEEKAKNLEDKADEIEKEIQEINEEEGDLEWHLKWKKK